MDSKRTAWAWKSLQDEGQSEGQGAGNSGRESGPPDTVWVATEDWGNRGMGAVSCWLGRWDGGGTDGGLCLEKGRRQIQMST